jgi:DNA-binding MarR family transcriptional regulator
MAARTARSADTALLQEWRSLMARHAVVSGALARELGEGHGLSVDEFEVLERLATDDHEQHRMQELADSVFLSQSTLSRLVARLEQAGLVERSLCDVDRRGIYACLTPAGRARYEQARTTQRAVLAEALRT